MNDTAAISAGARRTAARRRCSGQAMLEFVVMLAMMLGVSFALFMFLGPYSEYVWRILTVIGLEYP